MNIEFDLQRFATNKVPEMITDFRVYNAGGINFLGVATVDLPEFQSQTVDLSGMGIAGTISAPVKGHYDSLEMTLNWNTPTAASMKFVGGAVVNLELYANLQNYDSGESNYIDEQIRITVRGRAKGNATGTFEPANTTGTTNTIEVYYYKLEIGGKVIRELDKYNFKDVIDGVDQLSQVARNLGYY